MKKALITGVYGQDGSFLCEQLMKRGYDVIGIARENLSRNSCRIKKELDDKGVIPRLVNVDVLNATHIANILYEEKPDELYHMAAFHVSSEGRGNGATLREQEIYNKNLLMTANILECVAQFSPYTKVVTAGSCLMFDASETCEQNEKTRFCSQSLYGLAKISENLLTDYYRKLGIFACTAVLYNHESHRRAENFVTQKIVKNMMKIKYGKIEKFRLGNIETMKDWGFAGDYTIGMQKMLCDDIPRDYILATGVLHSIKDFITVCAEKLGIQDVLTKIVVDEDIISRKNMGQLRGNARLAHDYLGWTPHTGFEEIIDEMLSFEDMNYYQYENTSGEYNKCNA